MRLFIVRHGQTDWNKLKKFQGQVNIPLNSVGREQTAILAEALKDLPYDAVYTSPLDRCREMAETICGVGSDRAGEKSPSTHPEIIVEPLIIEIAFGIYEGTSFADKSVFTKDHPFHNYFFDRANYQPPAGAESFDQVLARAEGFLSKIQRDQAGKNVLAFSHGAFIRSLLGLVKGLDQAAQGAMIAPNNCSVTVLSDDSGQWKVEQEAVDIVNGERLTF